MCDCATELERKRREIENRDSLKSRSLSRVSSSCSIACSGDGEDASPGLLRTFMLFLRGEMSFSEVAQAVGFSGAFTGNVGVAGAVVGGGMLLAMLAALSKFHGLSTASSWNFNWNWRKPPERNCIPTPDVDEGPPKIHKKRLRWPPEDDDDK